MISVSKWATENPFLKLKSFFFIFYQIKEIKWAKKERSALFEIFTKIHLNIIMILFIYIPQVGDDVEIDIVRLNLDGALQFQLSWAFDFIQTIGIGLWKKNSNLISN